MCIKPRPAATALASLALLTLAAPAFAAPSSSAPVAASAKTTPASAQDRAAADRLEPLARAAFWAEEVNKNPGDSEAAVKLATAERELGKNQEAYTTTQQLLVIQPDNVDALLETARDAIAGNQGFYAIAPAKHAQQLRPKDWRAISLLGIAYEQTRQPDLALSAHQQALALAPDNPAALCNLGMFLAGEGDKAGAETLLRKAAALPGATPQVRLDLALVLGLEGKLAESERLQRQDLPPDEADNNMAYLRAARASGAAAVPTPLGPAKLGAPTLGEGAPSDRNWSALAKAQARDQTPIN